MYAKNYMKINDESIWELADKNFEKNSCLLSEYRRCKRNSSKILNICIIHLHLFSKCFMHVCECSRFHACAWMFPRAHVWQVTVLSDACVQRFYKIKRNKNLFIWFLSLLKFTSGNLFLCPNKFLCSLSWYNPYQFIDFHWNLWCLHGFKRKSCQLVTPDNKKISLSWLAIFIVIVCSFFIQKFIVIY